MDILCASPEMSLAERGSSADRLSESLKGICGIQAQISTASEGKNSHIKQNLEVHLWLLRLPKVCSEIDPSMPTARISNVASSIIHVCCVCYYRIWIRMPISTILGMPSVFIWFEHSHGIMWLVNGKWHCRVSECPNVSNILIITQHSSNSLHVSAWRGYSLKTKKQTIAVWLIILTDSSPNP